VLVGSQPSQPALKLHGALLRSDWRRRARRKNATCEVGTLHRCGLLGRLRRNTRWHPRDSARTDSTASRRCLLFHKDTRQRPAGPPARTATRTIGYRLRLSIAPETRRDSSRVEGTRRSLRAALASSFARLRMMASNVRRVAAISAALTPPTATRFTSSASGTSLA